jgi:hypothetical protein
VEPRQDRSARYFIQRGKRDGAVADFLLGEMTLNNAARFVNDGIG